MTLFAVIITIIIIWMLAIAWALLSKKKTEPDKNDCVVCKNGDDLEIGVECKQCGRMKR